MFFCKYILRFIVPLFVGTCFALVASYLLRQGHPHEDAFILFVYAENMAAGNGIVYFAGGGPAEGATDFLWMFLISVFVRFGVTSAWAAALINSIGMAVLCFVVQSYLWRADRILLSLIMSLFFGFLLLVSPIAAASYAGFSVAFYVSVIAIVFCLQERKKQLYLIPYLGLILGLIRPDGLIIGVTATLLVIIDAWRKKCLKRYVLHSFVVFVLGCIYFYWRYRYFGLLLPLPLYVKSVANSVFAGWRDNYVWFRLNILLIASSGMLLFALRKKSISYILASAPVGVLFVVLLFANQTQNVAYRFQAPATAIVIILLSVLVGRFVVECESKGMRQVVRVLGAIMLMGYISSRYYAPVAHSVLRMIVNHDYINYFPYHLNQHLSQDVKIIMTEAGRMAYWTRGQKYDLVGLNTPETAVNGPSEEFIEAISPDIIFIHTAGVLPSHFGDTDYFEMSAHDFLILLENELVEDLRESRDHVNRAAFAALDYLLLAADAHRIVFARYYERHVHMYAVRNDGKVDFEAFESALAHSYRPESRDSYIDFKRRTNEVR